MNVIDIILVILVGVIILRGWLKGLSGIMLSFASFAVSAILSWVFHPRLAEYINIGDIPYPLLCAISIVIIFIVSMLACGFITFLIKSIFKLPVLKIADKLLGIIFSLVCSLILLKLISEGITMLILGLNTLFPDKIGTDLISDSLILKIFS